MRRLALTRFMLGVGRGLGVTASASSPLDQLGWLGGCWESATDTRVTVEMWLPPAGAGRRGERLRQSPTPAYFCMKSR